MATPEGPSVEGSPPACIAMATPEGPSVEGVAVCMYCDSDTGGFVGGGCFEIDVCMYCDGGGPFGGGGGPACGCGNGVPYALLFGKLGLMTWRVDKPKLAWLFLI